LDLSYNDSLPALHLPTGQLMLAALCNPCSGFAILPSLVGKHLMWTVVLLLSVPLMSLPSLRAAPSDGCHQRHVGSGGVVVVATAAHLMRVTFWSEHDGTPIGKPALLLEPKTLQPPAITSSTDEKL
jgi:hypothetical protein